MAVARPRDPSLDARIIEAFRDLAAVDGPANVSISAVAERSGVSRSTIYRRWPSMAVLQFEAQTSRSADGGFPDLGSFRDEMIDAYLRLVDSMATGDRDMTAGQMGQMITSAAFSADVWAHRWGPDRDAMYAMWERALERGEVDASVDGIEVMNDMVATCIFKVMLSHHAPDRDEAAAFVDRLLAGIGRR